MPVGFSLRTLGAFAAYVALATAAFVATSAVFAKLLLLLSGSLILFTASAALFSAGAYRVKAIGFLLWSLAYLAFAWLLPQVASFPQIASPLGAEWLSDQEQTYLQARIDAVKRTRSNPGPVLVKLRAQLDRRLAETSRFLAMHTIATVLFGVLGANVAAHHYGTRPALAARANDEERT